MLGSSASGVPRACVRARDGAVQLWAQRRRRQHIVRPVTSAVAEGHASSRMETCVGGKKLPEQLGERRGTAHAPRETLASRRRGRAAFLVRGVFPGRRSATARRT